MVLRLTAWLLFGLLVAAPLADTTSTGRSAASASKAGGAAAQPGKPAVAAGQPAGATQPVAPPSPAPAKAGVPAAQELKVAAKDTLAGPLPSVVSADKSPYLVISDIYVPQGQTVIVEPGAVLLFAGFTGLKVQGTLLAKGTNERPIVFTSVNDHEHNPLSALKAAPYDWNGIQITEDGIGSHFSYCAIRYSVYGIVSTTRYIRIGPSLFQFNGRANLTVEGREIEVGDQPFEYNAVVPVPISPDSLAVLPDPNALKRNLARYSGLGVLLVGAIMSAVYTYRFSQSDGKVDKIGSNDPVNLSQHSSAQWKNAYAQARSDRAGMVWGYVIGVVGAAGFGLSFMF